MVNDKDFESIIPTAILTAYPRTLTDIPYAKEVFKVLNKNKIPDDLKLDRLALELEARYKLIDNLLNQSKISQVLELAAGYSTRGLSFTKNNKDSSYIELDLKEVCKKKINILKAFTKIPDNLHIVDGNALNYEDFIKLEKYLKPNKEIAVINEGLLRYLDFDEKRIVAKNIYNLLSKYGGVWITCDATPKKFILNQDKDQPNFNKNLSNISVRNNIKWRFEDINHVRKFFGEIGFDIEIHTYKEIEHEISSKEKFNLSDSKLEKILDGAIVVVMRVKK